MPALPTPEEILLAYRRKVTCLVPYHPGHDRLISIDLSGHNGRLTPAVFNDTSLFSAFISKQLSANNARYGMGGYLENREVYRRSPIFEDAGTDPVKPDTYRTIHLGMDIWGAAGTPIFAPLTGSVHSFGFNNNFGDYGATIILEHRLAGLKFHTLYGHLCQPDLNLASGQTFAPGDLVGRFGKPEENGHWPPHLHFQVIIDMGGYTGDYPGVCSTATIDYYRSNCPDPDLLLNLNRLIYRPEQF